jgi:uncharacterized membrane protein
LVHTNLSCKGHWWRQAKESFEVADLCNRPNSESSRMLYVLYIGGFTTVILALIGLSEAHTGVSRLFRELEEKHGETDTETEVEMNRAA